MFAEPAMDTADSILQGKDPKRFALGNEEVDVEAENVRSSD